MADDARPNRLFWQTTIGALLIFTTARTFLLYGSVNSVSPSSMGYPQAVLAHVTFVVGAFASFPVIAWLRRRWPPDRADWRRHAAAVLITITLFMIPASWTAVPLQILVHPGIVFRGSVPSIWIANTFTLATAVAAGTVVELYERLRHGEVQALRLEAGLAEARLQILSLQLHPHFLFNTLNAIAVLVHRDPAAADMMLTRLADLLRATLRRPGTYEVPLREELALLGRYLDIMRIRYGERLTVSESVAPALGDYLVPAFLLQPLVENALEHGVARRMGPGTVTIGGTLDDGRLRLTVTDDGPGPAAEPRPSNGDDGVGLSNTRRRLVELYGDAQRLALEPAPGGGTIAIAELPARRGPALSPRVPL